MNIQFSKDIHCIHYHYQNEIFKAQNLYTVMGVPSHIHICTPENYSVKLYIKFFRVLMLSSCASCGQCPGCCFWRDFSTDSIVFLNQMSPDFCHIGNCNHFLQLPSVCSKWPPVPCLHKDIVSSCPASPLTVISLELCEMFPAGAQRPPISLFHCMAWNMNVQLR